MGQEISWIVRLSSVKLLAGDEGGTEKNTDTLKIVGRTDSPPFA